MEPNVLHAGDCDCKECLHKWEAVEQSLKKCVESMGYKFSSKVICAKTWGKVDEQDNANQSLTLACRSLDEMHTSTSKTPNLHGK